MDCARRELGRCLAPKRRLIGDADKPDAYFAGMACAQFIRCYAPGLLVVCWIGSVPRQTALQAGFGQPHGLNPPLFHPQALVPLKRRLPP
jgi:hypothetical protein